jgi:hypothetical protein
VIFSIDHIVFAATVAQRDALTDELRGAGFSPEQFTLEFPEIGATSESLSYAGGGFVEFVGELDPALSPDVWFRETPRVIGLGFASAAFDEDTRGWTQKDAWRMNEDHVLPNGSVLNIHAAGPHHHLSDFYVFVMDRPAGALEFPRTAATPRLHEIQLQGGAAARWRRDLGSWLDLDDADSSLRVGDVTLRFEDGPEPSVRATLVFAGRVDETTTIPLVAGSITIAPDTDA